jgi:O-antigen/teichoic acid export membrane protein
MVFLTFGMETAYFRFIQDKPDKQLVFRNSFLTVLGLNAIFFVVILYFNQDLADLLLFPDHNEYITLLTGIVCIDAISSIPLARLRAEENAKRFALIQFSSIGVNIVLNLFFMLVLFDNKRPEEGILFILFANLFSSLVKPLMLYKDFLHISWKFNWKLAIEMSKYAIPIVIAGFAFIVNEAIDRIMLKQMLSNLPGHTTKMADSEIGIYSAWYKLGNQTKFGAYIAIGGAFLTILINYLFIPDYGYWASAWATMIVYGAQMVASYLLGQRYFPIRYNVRKFFLYLGVSLLIFFVARGLPLPEGSIQKFVVNNLLILGFIRLVMFMEGIPLRRPVRG